MILEAILQDKFSYFKAEEIILRQYSRNLIFDVLTEKRKYIELWEKHKIQEENHGKAFCTDHQP